MRNQTANILYSKLNEYGRLIRQVEMPKLVKAELLNDIDGIKEIIGKEKKDA
jgi:hypothetical protein